MKDLFSKILLLISVVLLTGTALYLNSTGGFEVGNANLWTTGKVFVVISVLTIVFVGIIFFLLHLERKISDLETRFKDKN